MKSEAEYKSGEVAYLLQGDQTDLIWGQQVIDTDYPVLIGNLSAEEQATAKVYSATFTYTLPDAQEATIEIKYGNSGTQLYLKPEESAAYYVVNGEESGKVVL